MRMPIDINKLKTTAQAIQNEIDTNTNVVVYVDPTTNNFFLNSMLNMLDKCNKNHISFLNLSKKNVLKNYFVNLAIIICGNSSKIHLLINAYSNKKIPVIFISITPENIFDKIRTNNYSNNLYLICPKFETYSFECVDNEIVIDFSTYNVSMIESIKNQFNNLIEKLSYISEISYACVFPHLRSRFANNIINSCAIQNAGISVLSVLPGVDIPLVTLNQARMVLELAAIYGYSINEDRVLEIIIVLVSVFAANYFADKIKTKSKLSKVFANSIFGASGTKVLGCISKKYFKSNISFECFSKVINSKFGNITSKVL